MLSCALWHKIYIFVFPFIEICEKSGNDIEQNHRDLQNTFEP
jgi:hypothetical protein